MDTLIRTFLRLGRARPSKLGLDGSFGEYVAFLNGLDMGTGGRLLEGFGEWVAGRVGYEGWELVWPLLVLARAQVERRAGAWHELSAHEDARAVAELFELLSEFARDRG